MGAGNSTEFNYAEQLAKDTEPQSQEVGSLDTDMKRNAGASRTSNYIQGREFDSAPVTESKESLTTVYEAFLNGMSKYPDSNCLGTRTYITDGADSSKYMMDKKFVKRGDYVWESYTDVNAKAVKFGAALVGLGAKAGDNVGIFSINRAEWVIGALGLYTQKLRTVSLYATLGADAVEYIAAHADLEYIMTSRENLGSLVSLASKLGSKSGGLLKHIIMFDYDSKYNNVEDVIQEDDVKTLAEHGIALHGFHALIQEAPEAPLNPSEGDDLCYVMYTSGTTGKPKGAMLKHSNIMATCSSVVHVAALEHEDVHFSYLPLAHIFETVVQVSIFENGGAVGFFGGNIKQLLDDLATLKPTLFTGVPRVFTKIYQKVFAGIENGSCVLRFMFEKSYGSQVQNVRSQSSRSSMSDVTLGAITKKLGLQNCRQIITGAAPCPPYLMEFLKVIIPNVIVVQGYGMTETAAAISISMPSDPNVGHVGPPLSCNEVMLVDVPEMNYTSADQPYPRGEICVRGPNVFPGYYKNEAATKDTIDEDGWLHTGDIGRWNANGTLSIIDRKKNIFKMAQGEYIAAEKIEMAYGKSPMVGQVWVYGNSFKSFVVAVVVPSADALAAVAVEKGWMTEEKVGTAAFCEAFAALCSGPHADSVKKIVFDSIKEQNVQLKGFEKARDIIIEGNVDKLLTGFTVENDCMTPTFKLRRPFLLKRYLGGLKDLYAKNGEPAQSDEIWPGEE